MLLITLNRPNANAIECSTSQELYEAFLSFEEDAELRVAILTGSGQRFFSAGWDLKAAADGEAIDADHGPGGFAGLTEYFSRTKPVIAAVNGMAVGGGFELALACDLIVAAEHAKFFLPEVQIGITPDSGGVFRLPRRVPHAIAMELMLTGRSLVAPEAEQWGLVNRVVAADRLLEEAWELAERICAGAPLAQRAIKELVGGGEALDVEDAFRLQRSGALPHYSRMLKSMDAQEGANAFAEGRPPVWKGY
ncbi:enoyl-CoA hydratase-related protein [Halomonas sp. MA07-2]|uniref:enoyl-CoA hydratase-related protein n=1 Tax=Halomonas sp. MA07-2 TaxID=3440841 RepID=UPI003EEE53DF